MVPCGCPWLYHVAASSALHWKWRPSGLGWTWSGGISPLLVAVQSLFHESWNHWQAVLPSLWDMLVHSEETAKVTRWLPVDSGVASGVCWGSWWCPRCMMDSQCNGLKVAILHMCTHPYVYPFYVCTWLKLHLYVVLYLYGTYIQVHMPVSKLCMASIRTSSSFSIAASVSSCSKVAEFRLPATCWLCWCFWTTRSRGFFYTSTFGEVIC